jgi:toxin ParE1/3/4
MMGSSFGSTRAELEGLRVFPVKGFANYLLFYRPFPRGIELIRVLHGARDIPSILQQNPGQ